MNSNMLFIIPGTKQNILLNTTDRVTKFGNILSSVILNRTNLIDDISQISNLNISFIPTEDKIDIKKIDKSSKSKVKTDESTKLIIKLAQILSTSSIKRHHNLTSSENPIEQHIKKTSTHTILTLNFSVIIAINDIIIMFLSRKNKKITLSKEVINVLDKIKCNDINSLEKDLGQEGKQNALLYKKLLSATSLHISFSSPKDNNKDIDKTMNLTDRNLVYKLIRFFFLFFPFIFSNVNSVFIDYNVYQLIMLYQLEKNPYSFIFSKMEEDGTAYDYFFLANLFTSIELSKLKPIKNLELKLNESYVIDSQCLLYVKDIIFIQHLLHLVELDSLTLTFNCLDPLLFQNIIHLIIVNRDLKKLALNLFPQEIVNMMKIHLNASYSNVTLDEEDKTIVPIEASDNCIDYIHLQSLTNKEKEVLKMEKVPKYLFRGFDTNLRNLLFVLEIQLESLKVFQIDLSPYKDILEYDSYNTSISYFIFNLFLILNDKATEKKLEEIKIVLRIEEYSSLLGQAIKQYHNNKRFGLDLVNLQKINMSMPNIRVFLDFNKMPFETLRELKIKKVSFEDFNELKIALKMNKQRFANAEFILISLDYSNAIDYETIGEFFRECLPKKYNELFFEFPFDLTLKQVITFVIKNLLTDMRDRSNQYNLKMKVIVKCRITEYLNSIGNIKIMKNVSAVELNRQLVIDNITDVTIKIPDSHSFELGFVKLNRNDALYSSLPVLNKVFEEKCNRNVKIKIMKNILHYYSANRLFLRLLMD